MLSFKNKNSLGKLIKIFHISRMFKIAPSNTKVFNATISKKHTLT
jgi:hypothetical protein